MCWERHLDWISLAQVGRACWKRHRQERSRLMRSLAGLKPGLYKEEGEKKDSRASITAGTVVFEACTMLRRPASRRAAAVTGPTATTAVLRDTSERERSTWPPLPSSQLRKLRTAEGLKNKIASRWPEKNWVCPSPSGSTAKVR